MTAPYYESSDGCVLHVGDCLDVLPTIADNSIDAVITDPPYGLAELSTAAVLQAIAAWVAGERTHVPDGRGFMGKDWDRFVPPPGVWDECRRVLKPGGHLLCFAAPRTYDLMTLSIRIAGFEIRDSIHWVFGSGFPKGQDIGKAIDRSTGAQRPVTGQGRRAPSAAVYDRRPSRPGRLYASEAFPLTVAATDDAKRWTGWNTQLKPAHEPIIVARKSTGFNTTVANVLEHGTGALNVDACRIDLRGEPAPTGSGDRRNCATYAQDEWTRTSMANGGSTTAAAGRWPTNLLLAHSPDCEQVGERTVRGDSRVGQEHGSRPGHFGDVGADPGSGGPNGRVYGAEVVPVFHCAPGCPVAEMDRPSGTLASGVLAPHHNAKPSQNNSMSGANYADRIKGTFGGDSGGASRFFPIFRYAGKAAPSERPRLADGTAHSTVKPLDLMRWLVRLVTPPGGGSSRSICRVRNNPRGGTDRGLQRGRHRARAAVRGPVRGAAVEANPAVAVREPGRCQMTARLLRGVCEFDETASISILRSLQNGAAA